VSAPPATVIFDLDGTLTDSRPGILRTTRYALNRLNAATGVARPVPDEADMTFMIGPPLRETFEQLVGAAHVEQMMGYYRERYQRIGLLENSVYDGVPQALAELQRAGHRLFVATSKNEKDARRILDHFGLKRYFHEIYGARDDGGRAVKSELLTFLLGRERIAAKSARVLMIGDRKFDALGAISVGISALGALWGYGEREELIEAGADPLIETPHQVPAAVAATLVSTH
jgi:phosphoglycolate phosphatase